MSDYGRDFIGAVGPAPGGGQELHWSLRPFWHHLQVRLHGDGVSVTALDDLASAVLPAQRQARQVPPLTPDQPAPDQGAPARPAPGAEATHVLAA
jgi:hypothetical protein